MKFRNSQEINTSANLSDKKSSEENRIINM